MCVCVCVGNLLSPTAWQTWYTGRTRKGYPVTSEIGTLCKHEKGTAVKHDSRQTRQGKEKKEGTRTPHHHGGTTFFLLAILSNGPWGNFCLFGDSGVRVVDQCGEIACLLSLTLDRAAFRFARFHDSLRLRLSLRGGDVPLFSAVESVGFSRLMYLIVLMSGI